MLLKNRSASLIVLGLVLSLFLFSPSFASDDERPGLENLVPFFYYNDLAAASDWYENKLGMEKITDEEFVVIFQITPGGQLGLVSATGGTLKPTDNKGAMLSIETAELEAWHERLSKVDGINMTQDIQDNGNGLIKEFRMEDPGGYIIEFYQWLDNRPESEKYKK